MKFIRWSKNCTIANVIAFFISTSNFRCYEKAKLLDDNDKDSIPFIDSTSINMNPDANKNQDN